LVLGLDAFIMLYQLITLYIGYLSYPIPNATSRGFPADPLLPPRNMWETASTDRPAVKEVIFENEEDDEEAQLTSVRPGRAEWNGERRDSRPGQAASSYDGGDAERADEEEDLYSEVDDLLQRTGEHTLRYLQALHSADLTIHVI
jgi:hypothetical protein